MDMKKGAALVLVPVLLVVMIVVAIGGNKPPSSSCSPGGQVLNAAAPAKGGGIGGWDAQSVANAATIINVGAQMGIPARGQELAVATAMDESSLHNLGYGDRDSLGLFQQRPSQGWGSPAQLLNPSYAARKFYQALLKTHGWQTEPPTVAIHNVQGNADPTVYAQFWNGGGTQIGNRIGAVQLSQALAVKGGGSGSGSSGGGGVQAASLTSAVSATSTCDHGGFGDAVVNVNGGGYVGKYSQQQLLARVQQLAHSGFDWTDECQHFVWVVSGEVKPNYGTAAAAWDTFKAEGTAHPANGPDGHTIPVGAWVYFDTANPAHHVALYVGGGKVASTDMSASGQYSPGQLNVVPLSAVVKHMGGAYMGWAAPWGQKVKVVSSSGGTSGGSSTTGTIPNGGVAASGAVTLTQANIPMRSGWGGFRASMHKIIRTSHPDFISLNEQFGRGLAGIEHDAPGYAAYRDPHVLAGPGGDQALDEVILWKRSKYKMLAGGRQLLERDLEAPVHAGAGVQHRPRVALWAMLQRKSDGAIISVVSTHMATNPAIFGPCRRCRAVQYGHAMTRLTQLMSALSQHGAVLLAGDLNAHPHQRQSWAPAPRLHAAGLSWYSADVDYVAYPSNAQLLGTATGHMVSDHPYVTAEIGLT